LAERVGAGPRHERLIVQLDVMKQAALGPVCRNNHFEVAARTEPALDEHSVSCREAANDSFGHDPFPVLLRPVRLNQHAAHYAGALANVANLASSGLAARPRGALY
jgi:hypothetical protein